MREMTEDGSGRASHDGSRDELADGSNVPARDASDTRPTAEAMLARLRDEERSDRGRLRVYLGMAPGVGKTYKALEEAHRRLERGTDVVVGFVEPHGRPRTEALLDGLEIVPRLRIAYHGVIVEEMNTDAVVVRHPAVAIIDELAHTNVPGSPREKRWEDVRIVLDAGIDVISTCNVQHVESVADAVATITGARVNERIPDEILESADEIELVDMSPHALRQRIRHGNVYPPDRARVALDRFFTEPNLMTLRDIALRFVTRRVDEQLEEEAGRRGGLLSSVTERVLVLIDHRPVSRRAMRRGAAMASALNGSLTAVVIDADRAQLRFDESRDLQRNVEFATDLGAEVVRYAADDLVAGLAHVASSRRITHVVLGHEPRSGLRRLRPSTADALLERLPQVEVHVVAQPPASDG